MADMQQVAEPWVDAEVVAKHLGCKSDHVRKMASKGKLYAVPSQNGKRSFWRFRISLVDKWLTEQAKESIATAMPIMNKMVADSQRVA